MMVLSQPLFASHCFLSVKKYDWILNTSQNAHTLRFLPPPIYQLHSLHAQECKINLPDVFHVLAVIIRSHMLKFCSYVCDSDPGAVVETHSAVPYAVIGGILALLVFTIICVLIITIWCSVRQKGDLLCPHALNRPWHTDMLHLSKEKKAQINI